MNELLADLDPYARLLFAGLWTIADREGRISDKPRRVKAQIFPYNDIDIDAHLTALATAGFIERYETDGVQVIQVVNFELHQRVHPKEAPSELPSREKVRRSNSQDTPRRSRIARQAILEGIEDPEGKEGKEDPERTGSPRVDPGTDISLPAHLETPEVRAALADWFRHKAELGKRYRPTGLKNFLAEIAEWTPAEVVAAVKHSTSKNYQGLFRPTGAAAARSSSHDPNGPMAKWFVDEDESETEVHR